MKGRRIPSVRRRRTTGRQNFKHTSWRAKIQALYPLFLHFISTRSTLPYLPNNRSKSDCRVSYSKFPQKTGFIFKRTVPKLIDESTQKNEQN
ncbi:hypothetical protein HanPSC8_Chr06g0238391 [Helianthus annuus]|nr:hypothetical protein HanPSC8_Chr06g0238391 [Helianthus annuus]